MNCSRQGPPQNQNKTGYCDRINNTQEMLQMEHAVEHMQMRSEVDKNQWFKNDLNKKNHLKM